MHRPVKCYLPVAVTLSTVGEQVTLSYSFCNSGDVLKSPHRGANYFTKTAYEQSPLSRTAQVKATALHDDSSGMQTFSKAIDNAIKRYPVGSNSQAIPSSNYAGGELQCTNVMGECYSFQW
ncbi:hypothetical protein [Siphonobacter sp. SORGH_AS_0500]|uniref:hypothetical protein n=1 Tax=Siphonobacter sp. SORGH_AS_0500 TaxID=1864824 RepID=UPI00286B2D09|nr:hypothetical protein [Siphonobacter sp. SORGH_AS_0500]